MQIGLRRVERREVGEAVFALLAATAPILFSVTAVPWRVSLQMPRALSGKHIFLGCDEQASYLAFDRLLYWPPTWAPSTWRRLIAGALSLVFSSLPAPLPSGGRARPFRGCLPARPSLSRAERARQSSASGCPLWQALAIGDLISIDRGCLDRQPRAVRAPCRLCLAALSCINRTHSDPSQLGIGLVPYAFALPARVLAPSSAYLGQLQAVAVLSASPIPIV
jgi:hypothetical protein